MAVWTTNEKNFRVETSVESRSSMLVGGLPFDFNETACQTFSLHCTRCCIYIFCTLLLSVEYFSIKVFSMKLMVVYHLYVFLLTS